MNHILSMLAEIRPEFDYEESENFIEDGMLDSFDIISLINMVEEKYQSGLTVWILCRKILPAWMRLPG